ncbi:hypothetical protein QUF74_05835 [Candidatus Halobeggiatoa sp. HSG11]|nr:hypothetical protein [Candidatus Halobeggiatoa sp. HSG11]
MRIKSKWNKRAKPQSIEDIAKAVGFISWQIATNSLLELENNGYESNDQTQRLQIIQEFLIFLIQVADRLVYEQLDTEQRQSFITNLAIHVANTLADNQIDIGYSEGKKDFINLLNQRSEDYSELNFKDGEAGFDFLRYFGEQVTIIMQNNRFISQQIVDIEGPDAIQRLQKGINELFV